MPVAPYNLRCSHLGCNNARSKFNLLCVEHGGRDTPRYYTNVARQEAHKMYDSAQWKRLRRIKLSENPLCAGCLTEGKVTPASDIDHLFPWRQLGKEAFYVNRFQSLCHEHHSMKTQQERKGVYIYWRNQVKTEFGLDDYKRLLLIET